MPTTFHTERDAWRGAGRGGRGGLGRRPGRRSRGAGHPPGGGNGAGERKGSHCGQTHQHTKFKQFKYLLSRPCRMEPGGLRLTRKGSHSVEWVPSAPADSQHPQSCKPSA